MAAIETYVSIMFMVLIGMALLFLWSRRKATAGKKYVMSDEATKEMGAVLDDYRRLLTTHTEWLKDVRLLSDSKDVIKQYLQVAIGLARLNREPFEELLDEYFQLAYFQATDLPGSPVTTMSDTSEIPEEMRRRRREAIARDTEILEKELKTFLKRKRLF